MWIRASWGASETNRVSGCRFLAVGALLISVSVSGAKAEDGSRSFRDPLIEPFAAFRVGVVASPTASADLGLDITVPRLRAARNWTTRLDVDLAARFNSPSFGSRRDASVFPALCQVYAPGGVNRGRWYLGAGAGPYFGRHSDLGFKLFGGLNTSRTVAFELEGQFPGDGTSRLVAMVRLSAL